MTALYPTARDALEAVHRASSEGRPTRLGPDKLRALRLAGLIYTARRPDGKLHAHLTKRGRQELGVPVGHAR